MNLLNPEYEEFYLNKMYYIKHFLFLNSFFFLISKETTRQHAFRNSHPVHVRCISRRLQMDTRVAEAHAPRAEDSKFSFAAPTWARIVQDSCYTTALVSFFLSFFLPFSFSFPLKAITHGSRIQREPVARRRKSPVNARDLVIPHGRLTRNCVHYRRIRFGSPWTGFAHGTCTQEVCILHDTKISIN